MKVLFNANRLRKERRRLQLTQAMLAEQAGTSERYIRSLETSEKENPSTVILYLLSKALHLSMDDLMMEAQEELP